MVKRVLNLLRREWSGLHEAAFLLAFSALASQFLALIRDRLLAAHFGAGTELDIYYAAFRLPDFLYALLSAVVSVSVLIPLLVKHLKEGETPAAQRLLNGLFTVFIGANLILSAGLFFLIPRLAGWLAPGFTPAALATFVGLSRWLLLSPLLLGLSNLLGAVTQASRRFLLYAFSPVIYNLGIIFGIVWLEPRFGLKGLVWGVALGALGHLLVQLPGVRLSGLWPRLTREIPWAEIKDVLRLSLPRTIALSADQFSFLVMIALASLVGGGAIAVFNFAFNLQAVPLVIIGSSYSVAAFPTLARLFASGERQRFQEQLLVAVRHILFWSLPVATLFIVLRAQIVRVILGAGRFNWSDTRLVAAALALFIFSVMAQNLIQLLTRAYYAIGQTRRPLFINSFSSVLALGLGALFLFLTPHYPGLQRFLENLMRVKGLSGTLILVLPLAYSIGEFTNLGLFALLYRRDFGALPRYVWRSLFQSLGASLAAGLATYAVLQLLATVLDLETVVGIFSQGLIAGLAGLLTFFLILRRLGSVELSELTQSWKKRFWKVSVVVPEPEGL
jgi:putative peptidoglycan lipid II flippase